MRELNDPFIAVFSFRNTVVWTSGKFAGLSAVAFLARSL